ncbi:hypothetical protein BMW24_003405 [Mycobacterium heckeshornense]|uniref:hypothetical protein n=1 Tax=Mycobacterium heckeshornense TaxID=110505 RepID=UPI0008FD46CB|nr:hypothetical protein [Mycobacterium heckeshornense]PIJ36726.1 hypothetical protein BMW24_003120 [Mycobacterium heckeshornense]PIJ36777.1 hypothetical protein BMW24_003405 [Mycobacterium heckeshornense]
MKYKLGLKPVQAHPRVRLCDYYTPDLPSVDSLQFPLGHAGLVKPQMYLNDRIGDCAIAGSIEEIRQVNALRGVTVNFTDETAVENYSAITGYVPGDELTNPDAPPNPTDQGTDVGELYDYRRSAGIVDADGKRHKIVAYAGLTPGDWDEMLIALSLFEVVGIGIQVPDYAEAQFEAGQAWHLIPGRHSIEGGHYIPVWGASDRNTAQLPTWGGDGAITAPFFAAYNTVAVVALTEEMFTAGKSPAGIDFDKLSGDLRKLDTGPVLAPTPRRRPRKDSDELAQRIEA